MPGYDTRMLDVPVGAKRLKIRALSDKQQYADPQGEAERAGICSASWSLFGQLWPASRVLAKAVKHIDIDERRILELGCGLGLPSLILQSRGADITASDHHPLSEPFLDHNAAINTLPALPYLDLPWSEPVASGDKGQFNLIIGSDILYERGHAEQLAALIDQLASHKAKLVITCPGRPYRNRFSRLLEAHGFELTQTTLPFSTEEAPPFLGRILRYRRGA